MVMMTMMTSENLPSTLSDRHSAQCQLCLTELVLKSVIKLDPPVVKYTTHNQKQGNIHCRTDHEGPDGD